MRLPGFRSRIEQADCSFDDLRGSAREVIFSPSLITGRHAHPKERCKKEPRVHKLVILSCSKA